MHILLTNDDGYDAPGLVALYQAIDRSHRISVVAPAGEQSICGHSATLRGPMSVRLHEHELMGQVFAVEGTPVDCVRLAISQLLNSPVDRVLSGINAGANVTIVDVNCSGTVAAAREAAFCGIPAAAISQMYRKGHAVDWTSATRVVVGLLPQLWSGAAAAVKLWNVNLPALPPGQLPSRIRVLPLSTDPIPLVFESRDDPDGRGRVCEYRGLYESRKVKPGTDIAAVFADEVSITPLDVDPTYVAALDHKFDLNIAEG